MLVALSVDFFTGEADPLHCLALFVLVFLVCIDILILLLIKFLGFIILAITVTVVKIMQFVCSL